MSIGAINGQTALTPTFAAPSAASAPAAAASAAAPTEAAPESTTTATAVVYSSPTQSFDPSTGAVVIQTRNTSTGVVESQTPGTAALQYERSRMLATEKADTGGHHTANS